MTIRVKEQKEQRPLTFIDTIDILVAAGLTPEELAGTYGG